MAAEGLLAPKWTRAVIGAAAATLVMGATQMVLGQVIRKGKVIRGSEGVVMMVALIVPLVIGGGASIVADLDRRRVRVGLAMLTGAATAVATFAAAAIWNFALPLAAAVPIGIRAFMTPPPPALKRIEHTAYWTFAGAFFPAVIGLFAAFAIKYTTVPPSPAGPGGTTFPHEVIFTAAAAVFGAVFTLVLIELDPERVPDAPPEVELDEDAAEAPAVPEAAPEVAPKK